MIDSIHAKTNASPHRICRVLSLPRSSYYAAKIPTPTQCQDLQIGNRIEAIFSDNRRRYGYRRIASELTGEGLVCSHSRVRRLMRERNLIALQPKSYKPCTSDGRADKPSRNLLQDQALPTKPNKVWAGDITYIPTSEGWRYLAVVIDLYSRRIVGWSLANHMRADLVCDALNEALVSRQRNDGALIFHSDRGSQYGSKVYRQILQEASITQSMSRRANPYDNAWTESFMSTLKREMLQDGCFIDDNDARTELFSFIEGYYNTRRKHSSLGYQSPSKFEMHFNQN